MQFMIKYGYVQCTYIYIVVTWVMTMCCHSISNKQICFLHLPGSISHLLQQSYLPFIYLFMLVMRTDNMPWKWHSCHKAIVTLKANDTQCSQSDDSKWWQEIASTVCRKRTTVSLISAIGTVIFTITPTCQRHTRTIQTSKVRRRTRCNQTSYTKTLQTYIYTHTLSHTQSIYIHIYSKHLIIQH